MNDLSGTPPLCRSDDVKHDHYALVAATMELGLVYLETSRWKEAERALETAKLVYTLQSVYGFSPTNTDTNTD